jgi:Region found in RelA / SpoT proteins
MAEWVQREHGKAEIDRSGQALIPWWIDGSKLEDLGYRFSVVENWRTSHGLPLNVFQAVLRSRSQRIEEGILVAQRMKRFSAVMNKLSREPHMKLSQMQDLGGCRAILSSVDAVDRLFGLYCCGSSDSLFSETESALKCHDYIRHPKDDGYRGIHVVGRYHPRLKSREPWNGHRIEIQLRTRVQHAFATAVETVTTFTREPLKFGAGPVEWRRFFSLMGSAMAIRESTALVAGTPHSESELLRELRDATNSLRVRERLRGWTNAVRTLPRINVKQFKWLLLVLNTEINTVKVRGYAKRREASEEIAKIEQAKHPELDAVLVWVRSVKDLRAAYPNYYADTRGFLEALDNALR